MYELTNVWQNNYKKGRFNRYPFDGVVTYTYRNLLNNGDPGKLSILDLGFGGGNNFRFFHDLGFNTFGIDASKEASDLVKKEMGTSVNNKLFVGDFSKMPFQDNTFNFALDRQSIGHNTVEKIKIILKEVHRVLNSNGKFLTFLFGKNCSDLKFGSEIKPGTIGNFKAGGFSKSGFLTPFDEKLIKKIFGDLFIIKNIDCVQRHNKTKNTIVEVYEVSLETAL